ncbi:hypothetical protein E7T06_17935 [Deinococcus sp. Arct2-2]|uniref:hypothetical protein n=1 Tax=Deinococcus sp. Arct2-2 TaxID=2568653 RepID=UPI0010A50023|nr:hypothetical protein [Deinococcus sp. Arct2-2]THF68139.1 hypothetical protein E7T06_17935 [Deinococcus sp. Arct2-2]
MRVAALLSSLLVLTCAPGAGAAPPSGYYPQKTGLRWTYSSGETQEIGPPAVYKGVRVVPVAHQYGSTVYTQDLMEYRTDGSVWLRGVNAGGRVNWYTPPLNVYPPGPLTPGQTWSSSSGTLKSASRVMGVEPVRVGSTAYNALLIRTVLTSGGRQSIQLTYFVPTVGVVRYQTADGSKIDLVK